MTRLLKTTVLILSLIMITLFLYSATTGYISDYKMEIKTENRRAVIISYRGRITGLHTQYNDDGVIESIWRISSWQLLFGHQWIRIFETRELIKGQESDDNVSQENLLSQHLWFRFSRLDRFGDTVYIWDNHPVPTLYKGTIEGQLILN